MQEELQKIKTECEEFNLNNPDEYREDEEHPYKDYLDDKLAQLIKNLPQEVKDQLQEQFNLVGKVQEIQRQHREKMTREQRLSDSHAGWWQYCGCEHETTDHGVYCYTHILQWFFEDHYPFKRFSTRHRTSW